MKKIMAMLICSLMLASFSIADEIRTERMVCSFGTNGQAYVAVTNDSLSGFVEEVRIDVPLSTVTAQVSVVAVPQIGANINLATNIVAADLVVRPRVKTTGDGGVATSTDTKYLMLGDKVVFSVTNTLGMAIGTNINYTAIIKTSRSGGQ